ncbi:rnhA [Symbiodinium sp. CCMP2592]|nr:rnhA [Symbiodinium sp. CCMP2592]
MSGPGNTQELSKVFSTQEVQTRSKQYAEVTQSYQQMWFEQRKQMKRGPPSAAGFSSTGLATPQEDEEMPHTEAATGSQEPPQALRLFNPFDIAADTATTLTAVEAGVDANNPQAVAEYMQGAVATRQDVFDIVRNYHVGVIRSELYNLITQVESVVKNLDDRILRNTADLQWLSSESRTEQKRTCGLQVLLTGWDPTITPEERHFMVDWMLQQVSFIRTWLTRRGYSDLTAEQVFLNVLQVDPATPPSGKQWSTITILTFKAWDLRKEFMQAFGGATGTPLWRDSHTPVRGRHIRATPCSPQFQRKLETPIRVLLALINESEVLEHSQVVVLWKTLTIMSPQATRQFDEQATAVARLFYAEEKGTFKARLEIADPLFTACAATPPIGSEEKDMWSYMWNKVVFGVQSELDAADKASFERAARLATVSGRGTNIGKPSRHWTQGFVYSSSLNPYPIELTTVRVSQVAFCWDEYCDKMSPDHKVGDYSAGTYSGAPSVGVMPPSATPPASFAKAAAPAGYSFLEAAAWYKLCSPQPRQKPSAEPSASFLIRQCRQATSFKPQVAHALKHNQGLVHRKLFRVGLDFRPVRRKQCRRGKRRNTGTISVSPSLRLLLHVSLAVFYYTTPHRSHPVVVICDASLMYALAYNTTNGIDKILQVARNKMQHSKFGNTVTLNLETLLIELETPPPNTRIPRSLLLSLKPPAKTSNTTNLPVLQPSPQLITPTKARTGRRVTHRTSQGVRFYTKSRLLLRSTGLRPAATPVSLVKPPKGALTNSEFTTPRIYKNSQRETKELAPPPRGAPGASANEECTPASPPLRTFLGYGSSARRERRREYRRWRRARKVLIRLGRLGKDTGKEGKPLNAAAKRSAGTSTAKHFKELLKNAEWKGPRRGKQPTTKATPQKPYGEKLKIATQNVQGMAEILKHQQTISLMTKYGLDVLILTETRSKSYYSYNSQGYQFIVNGSTKDPYAGVTTIIAPHIRPYIHDVVQHSPRLNQITIACREGKTHVIGAYAPHNKMDTTLKHTFWDALEDIFSATPLPEPTFIIGDMNVRLQGRSSQETQELGPHVYGKGRQFAQRKPEDNRTLYMNMLTGHSAVDVMTFKTPNLKHHITYRDKSPPPPDWSGFVTDPLGWLHLYDRIQTLPTPETDRLNIASNIRSFVTADPLPSSAPIPPRVDPLRFQSLDKLITRRKWLPSVLNVRAHHDTGFPSDHYLLVADCRVKLGAKIPKTSRPPTRDYSANTEFAQAFRKHYARNAQTTPLATPPDVTVEVYTDGSGSQGRCHKHTPAGWGYVMLAEDDVLEESSGPVITDDTHPFTFGAKVGSNNTGELQAWMEACAYIIRANPPADVTFYYDSKWMAQMVRGQARPKRHKELVHSARLLRQQLEQTTRIRWQWVKGHKGNTYNERADALAEAGKLSHKAKGGRFTQKSPLLLEDLTQDSTPTQGTTQDKYERFLSAALAAEKEVFPPNPATPQRPWITPDLAERLSIAKRMNAALDPNYSTYYKDLKKEARKRKREWTKATFENNPNPSHRSLWANLRKLKKGFSERKRRLVVDGRQIPWSENPRGIRHTSHAISVGSYSGIFRGASPPPGYSATTPTGRNPTETFHHAGTHSGA